MGVVWAATDELLGRSVAVKEVIPPPGLTAEQAELTRSRSLREARAAARITSRSAVNVYDVVEEDGRPWIVMERLDATSLSDLIRASGPLRPKRVAEIGRRLLEALTAAHASGVLHRDVKPSNVMITRDGRVVLTDFGIAAMDGDPSITTTGVLIGSAAYIAPERAQGEPATPASDLWSLGCTLFAALEGHPPFDRGNAMATLSAVLSDEPMPAPSAGPLAPVLEGLLRKDPRRRLSAAEADRLLKTVLGPPRAEAPPVVAASPRPIPATPSTEAPPPTPAGPPRRRSAVVLAALAAVVLALAAVLALNLLGGEDPGRTAASQSQPAGQTTTTESPAGTSSSPAPSTSASSTTTRVGAGLPAGQNGLPAGFRLHEDETGFSVAVPVDWQVTKDGPRTDFTEPGTGRFLRVDQTTDPQPDPVADWENQEVSVSNRLSGYERIRLEPVVYRDYDAADWEFTWNPDDGGQLHVLNRNLITGPDRAYALYWNTPEDQWADSLALFETFAETFQPAP